MIRSDDTLCVIIFLFIFHYFVKSDLSGSGYIFFDFFLFQLLRIPDFRQISGQVILQILIFSEACEFDSFRDKLDNT